MRHTKKTSFLYPMLGLAILVAIGIFQMFDRPERASLTMAVHLPQITSATTSGEAARQPAQKLTEENPDEAKYRVPTVVGDEKIIDIDPGDVARFQDLLNEARPGYTFRLGDGEYKLSGLRLGVSGNDAHWIKMIAAEDARPRLNMQGQGDFHVSGSYIYLQGFEIYGGQKSNLRIASTTRTLNNVYANKLKLHSLQGGQGASLKIQRNNANGVGVTNIFIENCDVSQSTTTSIIDGIGVNTVVLRNNFIHTDSGFAAGITFKGGSSRILIENNFIKGVRNNPAIIMGGRTFLNFFDSQYPDQEGVDQTARNNIIVDFDESAVSFQGIKGAKFYHNTIVTNSTGPIFNFTEGNTNDGSKTSKNQDIAIENNLVISRAASSTYAHNEAGLVPGLHFGRQMWIGSFTNAAHGRVSIPQFPLSVDTQLSSQKAFVALEGLQWKDVLDIETARVRFSPKPKSPVQRATASLPEVTQDFLGRPRAETTAFGALDN